MSMLLGQDKILQVILIYIDKYRFSVSFFCRLFHFRCQEVLFQFQQGLGGAVRHSWAQAKSATDLHVYRDSYNRIQMVDIFVERLEDSEKWQEIQKMITTILSTKEFERRRQSRGLYVACFDDSRWTNTLSSGVHRKIKEVEIAPTRWTEKLTTNLIESAKTSDRDN